MYVYLWDLVGLCYIMIDDVVVVDLVVCDCFVVVRYDGEDYWDDVLVDEFVGQVYYAIIKLLDGVFIGVVLFYVVGFVVDQGYVGCDGVDF